MHIVHVEAAAATIQGRLVRYGVSKSASSIDPLRNDVICTKTPFTATWGGGGGGGGRLGC